MKDIDKIIDSISEFDKSLCINVKISHSERERITVERLIEIRNSSVNNINKKLIEDFDNVIKFFLTEKEFQEYVIKSPN